MHSKTTNEISKCVVDCRINLFKMSMWQFSEDSQPLLRKCIEAAATDTNNKWLQKFGSKSTYNNVNKQLLDTDLDIELKTEYIAESNTPKVIPDNIDKTIFPELETNLRFYRELLDIDPVTNFDYISAKCLENPALFSVLAELPLGVVEKLKKHIYETEDIDQNFVESFYTIFLPTYLKKGPSRQFYSLLVEAKCYPMYFKEMLVIITKDFDIPSNIIHDFVTTLNSSEQLDYLLSLNEYNITNNVFIHHLPMINTAYRNCDKNEKLQQYIVAKLVQTSQNCLTDKNYGKLLTNVLQLYKSYPTDIVELENIVNNHRSVFKKSCLNIIRTEL